MPTSEAPYPRRLPQLYPFQGKQEFTHVWATINRLTVLDIRLSYSSLDSRAA